MKKLILTVITFCAFFAAADEPLPINQISSKSVFAVLDMAHQKTPTENILLSPFSLQECFGMISCGAGKQSSAELKSVLGLDSPYASYKTRKSLAESKNASFSSSNTLLVDKRLNLYQDFVNNAVWYFGGKVYKADFNRKKECADLLNSLVKEQSKGMFDNVVSEKDFESNPLTVLMNVLYFKSLWFNQFAAYETQKQIFNTSAEEKYQVDMMLNIQNVKYYNDETIHAVMLPYAEPRFQMIFLMTLDSANSVSLVTQKLAAEGVDTIVREAENYRTIVQIPKLDLAADNDLVPLLRDAGMKSVFDPATGDLDKIVKGIPLFIDQARQLVKLKIDENGTEMSAVTVAIPKAASIRETGELKSFHADHPYVIVLYDTETSAVLLSGIIVKPSAVSAAIQQ